MSDAIQALAFSQFLDSLKRAVPGVSDVLPANVVELMMASAKDAERDRVNDYTPVLPSIDQLNRAEALKELVKNLPFMPDRIDYLMDEQHGRCPAIEYDEGLFLPCCAKCKNGESLCTKHKEKGTPFGNYAERLEQWQGGANVGKLSFVVATKDGEKEYQELTFGQLIAKKKIGIEQIKQAIKDSHLPIRIAPRDLQIPLKLKKPRGRPPQRKVQALDLDGEEQSESEDEEERTESPKPEPKTDSTSHLKGVIAERKAAEKAAKEAEKAAEKERKAAEKAVKDAEKAAEKERKEAEKAKEKAAKEAAKAAEPPKPKKSLKPKVNNPVEASTDFTGDLSELNEAEDPNGNTVYVSNDNIVYNAQKQKIGTVDDEGNLVLL